MINRIKQRLLHFETDGNIIPDFVAARLKKSSMLRRIIHACFYMQCIMAVAAIAAGCVLASSWVNIVVAVVVGIAVVSVAFFALGGGKAEKTASYIMNTVYAAICFIIGGTAMGVCGCLMLAAALVAFISFTADYFRTFLLGFSPLKIHEEHYTLTCDPEELPKKLVVEDMLPPPPPPKSELMEIAESFMEILK
ncbi:MAG: hypothetical protein IJZ95_01560 [Oscillospiraceae bacterium]|nr:hypothetical protein [Oscillospiraceae bacterium]